MVRVTPVIRSAFGRLLTASRRASRYDLVLAVIPAAFLVAGLAGSVLAVPLETAVIAASALGGLAVVDALFLNPPRGPSTGRPPA